MSKTRYNTVTINYNVQKVTKRKEYKEMRDRVQAATGLDNTEVARLFGPAFSEFTNWLEQRRHALRLYEDTIVQQVLELLNTPKGSPYKELVEAANDTTGQKAAVEVKETRKPKAKKPKKPKATSKVIKKLIEYKEAHSLSNKALAKMVGINESTVWKWQAGQISPRKQNAERLAAWLQGQGFPIQN